MKGYKAFDKNLKCRDFQYEIGQTYEMDGDIECCVRGFHFCKDLADCYRFYDMSDDTRICKVDAIGKIKTDDGIKYCTNKIKILSEMKNPKIKSNVNTSSSGCCNAGYWNSGNRNTGNYNSGNKNTGHYNNGSGNSGDCNSGIGNTGHWNSGHYNSGNKNSGICNSGDWNSGKCNSGDWNSGNYNVGVFNCDTEPKIKIFDKESSWTMKDWQNSRAYIVMSNYPLKSYSRLNGEQEKTIHESATEDIQEWWDKLSEDDKDAVKSLPNFDANKFYFCTRIRV